MTLFKMFKNWNKLRKVRRQHKKVLGKSPQYVILSIDSNEPIPGKPGHYNPKLSIHKFNLEGKMLLEILEFCHQAETLYQSGHNSNVDQALGDLGISRN